MVLKHLKHEVFLYSVSRNTQSSRTFFSKKSNKVIPPKEYIAKEDNTSACNYRPLPVVLARGEGVHVWDVEGKHYLDFLGGQGALNAGHCHPKILQALSEQAKYLAHTSRLVYNNILPMFSEYVTQYFGYDKVLPMNSGVEAGETAVKIARRWGYSVKKICENEAIVVFPANNYWGKTISALSTSTNPIVYERFGPYTPGFGLVPFNDLCALEEVFRNKNVCAYFMEPIQGEAGVVIPGDRYLREVRKLCTQNNVLWIGDEILTGLGRTGALLGCDHECVRPDILLLGKALGGGFLPISAVLANDHVMSVITTNSHRSTFGGNPLAARVAIATLSVIQEECLSENALVQGEKFRNELICRLPKDTVPTIKGKGLINAIEISKCYGTADNVCCKLLEAGLITSSCDCNVVRFTPPLNVSDVDICQAVDIVSKVINSLKRL